MLLKLNFDSEKYKKSIHKFQNNIFNIKTEILQCMDCPYGLNLHEALYLFFIKILTLFDQQIIRKD